MTALTTALPLVIGTIDRDGAATITTATGATTTIANHTDEGAPRPVAEVRRLMVEAIAAIARDGGHEAVHARLTDPDTGTMEMAVTSSGEVRDLPAEDAASTPEPAVVERDTTTPAPATRREARQSFLAQEQAEEPATNGWRGFAARLGLRVSPSEAERAERADVHAVSQHWPGPRTIAIVNGKGGANKTPTTILLSALFARYGGAGVLAWDNNQTRGTLGWRSEQGPHEATLLDLLPQAEHLLGSTAQSADLARYVHHQTADKYDVLRSKPAVLASEQRITADDVDAIHAVSTKYYRLVFIDSGNDETDPLWLRMIDLADQVVLATTTRAEHAEAGALLLEALADRDEHCALLAKNAVAIISQADKTARPEVAERVAEGYRDLARDVATIPFDDAMSDGVLRYGALAATTQRAWLGAAAAVARGL